MNNLIITNKTARALGLHFGLGAMAAVGLCIMIALAIQLLLNAFDVGTDSTDVDGWNRSGMRIHRDAKTGVEYLSTSNGGMVRREYR
jgi:hypothetical protein